MQKMQKFQKAQKMQTMDKKKAKNAKKIQKKQNLQGQAQVMPEIIVKVYVVQVGGWVVEQDEINT